MTTQRTYKPNIQPQYVIGADLLGIKAQTTDELISVLQGGLELKSLEKLGSKIFGHGIWVNPIPMNQNKRTAQSERLMGLELAGLLGISQSTYQRRSKPNHKLQPKESEGVYRIAALFDRATEVFGTEELARQWLNQPIRALGGKIPIQYARTEVGAHLVMQILGRIEHGVVS
jgi:putative toxin-antitoxin system antitoxin component (TIGR02293 family)